IVWLQVTSIDKRIDFPRIHLDHHQLPSEFLAPAKETNPLRWSFRVAHLRCEPRFRAKCSRGTRHQKWAVTASSRQQRLLSFILLSVHCKSQELQDAPRGTPQFV